jgi:RHS repeat-associated protein
VTKCSAEGLSVTADAQNRLHASGADYQYDAAGNMIHDATSGLNYTFDPENRITSANGYVYTYDSDGNRVRKSNGNTASSGTLYWDMMPGIVGETDLAGNLKSEYVFFNGERVARRDGVNGAGGIVYYFSDYLKTASVIADSTGTTKAESDYYPWGGELQFVANDSNSYKFTGKERDAESGLDDFGARFDSSSLSRFITVDSGPFHLTNPGSLNRYSYALNNPLRYLDADGKESIDSTLLHHLAHYWEYRDQIIAQWGEDYRAGKAVPDNVRGTIDQLYAAGRNGDFGLAEALGNALHSKSEDFIAKEATDAVTAWINNPKTTLNDLEAASFALDGVMSKDDIPEPISFLTPEKFPLVYWFTVRSGPSSELISHLQQMVDDAIRKQEELKNKQEEQEKKEQEQQREQEEQRKRKKKKAGNDCQGAQAANQGGECKM